MFVKACHRSAGSGPQKSTTGKPFAVALVYGELPCPTGVDIVLVEKIIFQGAGIFFNEPVLAGVGLLHLYPLKGRSDLERSTSEVPRKCRLYPQLLKAI